MDPDEHTTHRRNLEYLHAELAPHRDVLEAVAALDNPLSADARAALALLDKVEPDDTQPAADETPPPAARDLASARPAPAGDYE